MPARDPEELGDDLDSDLAWRRTEMHAIRSDVEGISKSAENTPRSRALLRAGVALLYAHWEGYAKQACQGYLDYVAHRKLQASELNDAFVMLAVRHAMKQAEHDAQRAQNVLNFVRKEDLRPTIPRNDVIKTEANLRHATLERLLASLGLPFAPFELKSQLIDRSLCDARNDIAHGRALFPSRDDFLALHSEVLAMMESLRDAIAAAVAAKSYRFGE